MKLIQNGFLILGLSNESSLKELQRREKEIKHLIKNDEFPEYETDLVFTPPVRTLHSLQEAKQALSVSKTRVLHDFFWFNLSESKEINIFNTLKEGNYLESFEEWKSISQGNELKNYISKKNYVISVCLVSQIEKISIQEIEQSLYFWKEILDSDKYWNFFEKNYLLNDELEISASYFSEFRENVFFQTLELIYLDIWKKQGDEKVISLFCDIFSNKNVTIQDYLLIPIYEKIEKSISILENLNAGEDGILDNNEKKTIENEKELIQIQLDKLKELKFYDLSRSKDLRDRVADSIRLVTLDISNNIGEDEYAKNLISFAKKIAGTDGKTHKMDQDLTTLSESVKLKPIFDLIENKKYQEVLDQLGELKDIEGKIIHAIKLRCCTSLSADLYVKAWEQFNDEDYKNSEKTFLEINKLFSLNLDLYSFNTEVLYKIRRNIKNICENSGEDFHVFDILRKKIRKIADNNFEEDSNENFVLIILLESEMMPLMLSKINGYNTETKSPTHTQAEQQVNVSEESINEKFSFTEYVRAIVIAFGVAFVMYIASLLFSSENTTDPYYNSSTGKCDMGYVKTSIDSDYKCFNEDEVLEKITKQCSQGEFCIKSKLQVILTNNKSNPTDSFSSKFRDSLSIDSKTTQSIPTPLSCNNNQCLYKDKCIAKPANAYCVTNDPQNAWLCKYGYTDTGVSCVYKGFTILEKNNSHFGGYGELEIDNSASTDSIIKIVHSSSRNKIIDLYLSKDQRYTVSGIKNGYYEVYTCNANQNNITKKLDVSGCSKFEDSFDFTTRNTTRGIQYSVFEITLYETVGGNAQTENVPSYLFDSL